MIACNASSEIGFAGGIASTLQTLMKNFVAWTFLVFTHNPGSGITVKDKSKS